MIFSCFVCFSCLVLSGWLMLIMLWVLGRVVVYWVLMLFCFGLSMWMLNWCCRCLRCLGVR